jgi:glutathionyl-hydroquinone reductase
MTRKQYYVTIICISIVLTIVLIMLNVFYYYSNAKKVDIALAKVQPNITNFAKVICDPILNSGVLNSNFVNSSEVANQYCRELLGTSTQI